MSERRIGYVAVVFIGIRIGVMCDPQLCTRREKIYTFCETRRGLIRWHPIELLTGMLFVEGIAFRCSYTV